MTPQEAKDMAQELLAQYGDRGFEVSMGDEVEYDLIREAFTELGRESGPDGEFFIVRVAAEGTTLL